MDLSVLILNMNNKDLLEACLKSIYGDTTKKISFEVIVVDNGSVDDSVDMVKKKFSKVVLIENKENRGFSGGNNQAMKKSKGRYVLLLNNDTEVLPGTFEKMVEFMDKHSGAGGLGCKVFNPDRSLQISCCAFPPPVSKWLKDIFLNRLFPHNKVTSKHKIDAEAHKRVHDVDYVIGACLLVRREAMEQVGLIDEQFFIFAEEIDWCYRIRKAGWKIYYIPNEGIIHYVGLTTRHHKSREVKERFRLMALRNMFIFYKKNYGVISMVTFKIVTLLRLLTSFLKLIIKYILKRDPEVGFEILIVWKSLGLIFQRIESNPKVPRL